MLIRMWLLDVSVRPVSLGDKCLKIPFVCVCVGGGGHLYPTLLIYGVCPSLNTSFPVSWEGENFGLWQTAVKKGCLDYCVSWPRSRLENQFPSQHFQGIRLPKSPTCEVSYPELHQVMQYMSYYITICFNVHWNFEISKKKKKKNDLYKAC